MSKTIEVETEYRLDSSNQIIKSHPNKIRLPNGKSVLCNLQARQEAMVEHDRATIGLDQASEYISLHKQIKFKVLKHWVDGKNTTGTLIRWRVPEGSKFIGGE